MNVIIFVSQNHFKLLFPLIKNHLPIFLQVAGKTIIEWIRTICLNHGIEKIFLIVDKKDVNQVIDSLCNIFDVKLTNNEIDIFSIIGEYESTKGLTINLLKKYFRDHLDKRTIWLDGNIIFSTSFFRDFYLKIKDANNCVLFSTQDKKQSCLGLGDFDKEQLEQALIGTKNITEIYQAIIQKSKKEFIKINYDKDIEFWEVKYPWNLLDVNQKLIEHIDDERLGEIESGVTIIGKVKIGKRTKIRAGSYIEGPIAIGQDCDIGPNCYLRSGVSLGNKVRIGNACEIKNSIIFDGTHIAHLSYCGDSIIGANCNFGAGTITGNLRLDNQIVKAQVSQEIIPTNRRKFGVVMGDNVKTAINVNFMPGVIIGNDSAIGAGVTVNRNIDSNKFVYIDPEKISTEWKVEKIKKD